MRRIVQAADSVSVMFFKTELRNVMECFFGRSTHGPFCLCKRMY